MLRAGLHSPLDRLMTRSFSRRLTDSLSIRWTKRTRTVRQDHCSCFQAVLWARS
jgi:hypothetical protein